MYLSYKNPLKKPIVSKTEPKNENNSFEITMLETSKLYPNPSQPRFIFEDEPMLRLADSIRRYGILQPLSVRPTKKNDSSEISYQIIAGERRWRAARIIGLDLIPCIVLNIDSRKSAELAIIENIQREDLNIFEQAAAIASLIDIYGLTQEQAAKQLSSSQSYLANKLRILKLTPKERTEIIKHNLTERHARALLKLDNTCDRLNVIQTIASKELNVAQTDRYIDSLLCPKISDKVDNKSYKGAIKDLKIFHNTVDKAVNLLRGCGATVFSETTETDDHTLIQIRIMR